MTTGAERGPHRPQVGRGAQLIQEQEGRRPSERLAAWFHLSLTGLVAADDGSIVALEGMLQDSRGLPICAQIALDHFDATEFVHALVAALKRDDVPGLEVTVVRTDQ